MKLVNLFSILLLCTVVFTAGAQGNQESQEKKAILNNEGKTLTERFNPPEGYERIAASPGSFAEYLRQLPLKPPGSSVLLFNGKEKPNRGVYLAVVDLAIGKKDLHQCADAIMRLRAEYLWKTEQYSKIHFNFTNGFRVNYSEWMQGKRVSVKGNDVKWIKRFNPSNTYDDLWAYLEIIFSYAGTFSLSQELSTVPLQKMQTGDIFIQGGFPGHAVLVADMAVHKESGKKLFLLLQSYMPAQEIQVLANPGDPNISPWYSLEFTGKLATPEWMFSDTDLKRFTQ